jgi:hypothetical protein
LVKNTGVSEADVVPCGRSRRGAGASGNGLVLKAADQEEQGVGSATLPDLNVQPKAEDILVCVIRSTPHLPCPSLVVIRVRSNQTRDES